MRSLLWSFSSLILCLACSPPDAGRSSTDSPNGQGSPNGGDDDVVLGTADDDGFVSDDAVPEEEVEIPEGCGDGALEESEACDDGNSVSDDGCAANCAQLEPGFSCAEPGKPCIPLAICGDAILAANEPCDDGNGESGDGCSDRCRVELGSKCEGEPSTCTPTTCGDGIMEGAEACDDGNKQPFDGCSSLCLREPDCQGLSCTSECGDGLLIDEQCDDGNLISGDGCSAECTIETGFTCERAAACEQINGECVVRVPAIFRDFSESHPDFGGHACSTLAQGAVERDLNAEGRPVMSAGGSSACLSSAENFAQWYSTAAADSTTVSELVLFDNGRGGFVNRFDDAGNYYVSTGDDKSHPGGSTLTACETSCEKWVANEDFGAGCDNFCNSETQDAAQAPLKTANAERELENAIQQYGSGGGAGNAIPPQVAAAQAKLDAAQAAGAAAIAASAKCQTDCTQGLATGTAECAATCRPCSAGVGFCTFGKTIEYEGNPLFFPVDSLDSTLGTCSMGNSAKCAKLPAQYGHIGWPWEHTVFENAPEHNFSFTSEVQYWFQYDAGLKATLDFAGDDDVWVFINGKLAVDIGGIHVPVNGSVTIDAALGTLTTKITEPQDSVMAEAPLPAITSSSFTAAEFGLAVGQVYKITVFHAERQKEGSSFKLTLSGFEATPSECSAICGDGVLSFGEECDDGINDAGYGECAENCRLGPFCGDGIVQEQEECDRGPGGGEGCPNCRKITPKMAK